MGEAGTAARQHGHHGKRQHKKQRQVALGACHTVAPAGPAPQQQRPIHQQLQNQKTQHMPSLPAPACPMFCLVGERYPAIGVVPINHRHHHQHRDDHCHPSPGIAQQRGAVGQQQASRHRKGGEDGRVFAQARQPQQHPQHQPRQGAAHRGCVHQVQRGPYQQCGEKHQQRIGQQPYTEHMQQGRQRQGQHRP